MSADWITNCDTAGGFVADWTSTSAWVMALIAAAGHPSHVTMALGFPIYAVSIGCSIGLACAIGAGVCHREVNRKNQPNAQGVQRAAHLTKYHGTILTLDAVVHIAETAAVPSILLELASHAHNISTVIQGSILLGFIPISAIAAIAEIRVCRNALLNNTPEANENVTADWITNFAAGIKGLTSWLSTASLLATFMSSCSGFIGMTTLGFPLYALIVASITALVLAMGAAYSHWVLSRMNQNNNLNSESGPLIINNNTSRASLSVYQWLALIANTAVNTANIAAIPALLIQLTKTYHPIKRSYSALAIGCLSVPGVFSALADTRNCREAMHNYNRRAS